jgi:hypothetical protein
MEYGLSTQFISKLSLIGLPKGCCRVIWLKKQWSPENVLSLDLWGRQGAGLQDKRRVEATSIRGHERAIELWQRPQYAADRPRSDNRFK